MLHSKIKRAKKDYSVKNRSFIKAWVLQDSLFLSCMLFPAIICVFM